MKRFWLAVVLVAAGAVSCGVVFAEEVCVPDGEAGGCVTTYSDAHGNGAHAQGGVPAAGTAADVTVPTADYDAYEQRIVEADVESPAGPVGVEANKEGNLQQKVVVETPAGIVVAYREYRFYGCASDEQVAVGTGASAVDPSQHIVQVGSYREHNSCFAQPSRFYVRVDGREVAAVPDPRP